MVTLWVSDNNSAVDAALFGKGDGLEKYLKLHDIDPSNIAYIGDGASDLDVPRKLGVGLFHVPSNASKIVKMRAFDLGGFVSDNAAYGAFEECYGKAKEKRLGYVFSDRDGVLTRGKDLTYGPRFREMLRECGKNQNPEIFVLTGGGLREQEKFIQEYGFDGSLRGCPAIVRNPFRLLLENGMEAVNVVSLNYYLGGVEISESATDSDKKDREIIPVFRQNTMDIMSATIMQDFGFQFTEDYNDQNSKVYCPPKKWMVTVNVPRERGGVPFRGTSQSRAYKSAVINSMETAAGGTGINLKVL